jgi:hypothetical protein
MTARFAEPPGDKHRGDGSLFADVVSLLVANVCE